VVAEGLAIVLELARDARVQEVEVYLPPSAEEQVVDRLSPSGRI
jgi:hypothetical protein